MEGRLTGFGPLAGGLLAIGLGFRLSLHLDVRFCQFEDVKTGPAH